MIALVVEIAGIVHATLDKGVVDDSELALLAENLDMVVLGDLEIVPVFVLEIEAGFEFEELASPRRLDLFFYFDNLEDGLEYFFGDPRLGRVSTAAYRRR